MEKNFFLHFSFFSRPIYIDMCTIDNDVSEISTVTYGERALIHALS